MPLEKQNKTKKDNRRQKYTRKEKGEERERNDRLDSEEDEIKKCSHLLERYLCKTSGKKMIDIQN